MRMKKLILEIVKFNGKILVTLRNVNLFVKNSSKVMMIFVFDLVVNSAFNVSFWK